MDFKAKCKNLRAMIVLTATFIAMLLNIKYERDIVDSLIIVIIVLIVFYIIASIAIKLIEKIVQMEPQKNNNTITEEIINETDEESKTE